MSAVRPARPSRAVAPCAAPIVLALLLAGAAPPTAAAAADGAYAPADTVETVLEGWIVDATTRQPVPRVLLRFERGGETLADGQGRYHVEGLMPGPQRVLLVTSRCRVTWARIALEPGEIRQVAFAVPTEVELPAGPEEADRAWRRRSQGIFLTAEQIDAMRAPTLVEVVRRVAPEMVGSPGGQAGGVTGVRARSSTSAGEVAPVVVVDGAPVADGALLLSQIRPSDVESVEILKGAAGGWAYGTGGSGGLIRIETRRGEEGHWNADPRRCEIPSFPPFDNSASAYVSLTRR